MNTLTRCIDVPSSHGCPQAQARAAKTQDLDIAHLPEALLKVTTVAAIVGCGRSTIWQWVKDGKFPPPKALGRNMSRWKAGEVMEWLRQHEAGARGRR